MTDQPTCANCGAKNPNVIYPRDVCLPCVEEAADDREEANRFTNVKEYY